MGTNVAKILAVLFPVFVLLNACNDTPDNPNTPDNTDDPERFQVYNMEDGTPFNETCVLVGRPSKPDFIPYMERDPNYIFTPSSSTRQYVDFYPWTVGKINRGKIAIGFPDEKLELGSDFEYSLTEGVRICIVYITRKDNSNWEFELCKKNSGIYTYDFDRVYIYYASADFNRPHNGIAFKAGWNFIERIQNPNWFAGSAEPGYIIVSSQDVNNFLEKGYRWQSESWF